MSYEIPSFFVGVLPSDADLSVEASYQYTAVCVGAAANTLGQGVGGAALQKPSSGAAVGPAIGILQNNPVVGEAGVVMVHGVSKAICHTAWSIGQLLAVDAASGGLIPATSGLYAVAQALENAAVGDISTVLLVRNGKQ